MATNNSDNNTTLDNALEELLNDAEFCRHFDMSHPQYITSSETTNVIPPPPSTTIHESVSSAETTPNSLDTGFLNESNVNEQPESQTTREVTLSLHHLIETITKQNDEMVPSLEMNISTDTTEITSVRVSMNTMTKTSSMKSVGTMPITPIGFKSIGTMPMTPTGFKSIGTMSEIPTTTSRGTMSSPTSSPRARTDLIDLVSPTIIETIDLCSPDLPTDATNII